MLNKSYIKEQSLKGMLSTQTLLRPKTHKVKKTLMFTIMLTSLVDAFCILVIFLLTNATNTGQPLDWRGKYQLPASTQSEAMGLGTVVRIESTSRGVIYSVNSKDIAVQDLVKELLQIKNKENLIVQADRGTAFQNMNPVILAASQSGFEKFQFAVLPTQISLNERGK